MGPDCLDLAITFQGAGEDTIIVNIMQASANIWRILYEDIAIEENEGAQIGSHLFMMDRYEIIDIGSKKIKEGTFYHVIIGSFAGLTEFNNQPLAKVRHVYPLPNVERTALESIHPHLYKTLRAIPLLVRAIQTEHFLGFPLYPS